MHGFRSTFRDWAGDETAFPRPGFAMELTCYVYDGWEPGIRPASPRREWMDATPERFAYRCLPLAIANAHGWELPSACGFRARRDGGTGVGAVEIVVDPQDAASAFGPVSLFGDWTITFHVPALFRTEPRTTSRSCAPARSRPQTGRR